MLNSRAAVSPRAYESAARIVRSDADEGKPLQQFLLGVLSREQNAPPSARLSESKRRAYLDSNRDKIRRLAELQENSLAWYLLSMESDDLALLKRAADGGNVQALNAYGTIRLEEAEKNPLLSTNELEKVRSEAYRCFKWASDQGDVNGFYNVGVCHMNGYGCKRDVKLAFDCFRAAAEQGHAEAINNLGGFFRDGIVVRRNPEISVLWFKKSSELENEFGMLNYGMALLSGEGVEKNQEGAVKLFKDLSETRAHPEGMNLYGMCLLRGTGVAKDPEAAVRWFEKSAVAGFPMAMDNLSGCYEGGVGIGRDPMKALEWKMRARAASGDRAAAEWLRDFQK